MSRLLRTSSFVHHMLFLPHGEDGTCSLSRGEEAAGGHDEGGEEEGRREVLAEEKDGEQRADEWCEGVVGAGAGGTDRAPGVGVEIDTQTIRHKAQEQQDKHLLPRRKGIVLRQRKGEE